MEKSILIIGAGSGLSASLARRFHQEGYDVGLAARNCDKLSKLAAETRAKTYPVDAGSTEEMARLFEDFHEKSGIPFS